MLMHPPGNDANMFHGPALWVALVAGMGYFVVMVLTAGRRYNLLRSRFFLYSGPGVIVEGAVPVYLFVQFRLFVPLLVLLYLAGRTIRVERERGESKPFIATLQLWPLEIAVLVLFGGVEYLVSTWLGLSTQPFV